MPGVVITAGGTGGHLFPAQALARKLPYSVTFLGPKLSSSPFFFKECPYVDIPASKKPHTLIRGIFKSMRVLRKTRPETVIGFGSFHTLPVLLAALLLRIPIVLYEPNRVTGRVNRLFSRFGTLISNGVKVPLLTPNIVSKEEARAYYGLDPKKKTVLICGGSQGAQIFDSIELEYQVIHIIGKHGRAQRTKNRCVKFFEEKMNYAWCAADLAISRAGASSVAEHEHFDVPTIFIPFPGATDDHQMANAESTTGSITLPQNEIHRLGEVVEECMANLDQMHVDKGEKVSLASLLTPYHLVGIGGVGMRALAQILIEKGHAVSGSDRRPVKLCGIDVCKDACPDKIPPLATVVYSSAIREDHPERNVSNLTIHRSDLLAELITKKPLLVAGAHGKTSTSSLLTWVLTQGEMDPTFAIGGTPLNLGKNGGYGRGDHAIAEVDESDGSFLRFPAHHAILTNIDLDHIDYWQSEEKLLGAYQTFIDGVTDTLFWCYDDPKLKQMRPKGISYGFDEGAEIWARNFSQSGFEVSFEVVEGDQVVEIHLPLIGKHNAQNALGVYAMARHVGLSSERIKEAFVTYLGTKRRMDFLGEYAGARIYDDYAHHPKEIATTLEALKSEVGKSRLIVAFQPHRYSRTGEFMKEYADSLSIADKVILTEIFPAGEKPIEGVTSKKILKSIAKSSLLIEREELTSYLKSHLKPTDVLVTMGAGDITFVGREIV